MAKYTHIFLLLLAASLLTACNVDGGIDKDSRQEISFSPASGLASTKTVAGLEGIIDGTAFPTDKKFAMCTFHTQHDAEGHSTLAGAYIFMNMEEISYSSTDNLWHTKEHHYWPLDGGLYCLGFYPTMQSLMSAKMIGALAADRYGNLMLKNINIKHSDADDNAITEDASKTDANLSHAKVDLMTSTTTVDDVTTRTSNSVPVEFIHQLAKIKFSVQFDQDYSSYTFHENANEVDWYWTHWMEVFIDEIKLTDIYSVGSYSINSPHWPTDSLKEPYTYYPLRRAAKGGTSALYKTAPDATPSNSLADKANFGTRTPYKTPVSLDGVNPLSILLIPQRVSDAATVEIKISVRNMNVLMPSSSSSSSSSSHIMNDVTYTTTQSFKLKDLIPFLTSGTCTNIVFSASMDEIKVGVDYEAWEDGKTNNIAM